MRTSTNANSSEMSVSANTNSHTHLLHNNIHNRSNGHINNLIYTSYWPSNINNNNNNSNVNNNNNINNNNNNNNPNNNDNINDDFLFDPKLYHGNDSFDYAKLLLGDTNNLYIQSSDTKISSNSDFLLSNDECVSQTPNHQVHTESLAELKPLPPLNSNNERNLYLNNFSNHHYRSISVGQSSLPEENNNTYVSANYVTEQSAVANANCLAQNDQQNSQISSEQTIKIEAFNNCDGNENVENISKIYTPDELNKNSVMIQNQNSHIDSLGQLKTEGVDDFNLVQIHMASSMGSMITDSNTVPSCESKDFWYDTIMNDSTLTQVETSASHRGNILFLADDGELPDYVIRNTEPNNNNSNSNNNITLNNNLDNSNSTLETLFQQDGYLSIVQNNPHNGINNGHENFSSISPMSNVDSPVDSTLLSGSYLQNSCYPTFMTSISTPNLLNSDNYSLAPSEAVVTSVTTSTAAPVITKKSKARSQKKGMRPLGSQSMQQHQLHGSQQESHHQNQQQQSQLEPQPLQAQQRSLSANAIYQSDSGINSLAREKTMHYCNVCKRGFLNKSNIKVHLRTHTGEKPFQCSVCTKPFRQKAHLLKHQQIHNRAGRDCH